MSLAVQIDWWFSSLRAESHLLTHNLLYDSVLLHCFHLYTCTCSRTDRAPCTVLPVPPYLFDRIAAYQQSYKSRLSPFYFLQIMPSSNDITPNLHENPSINLPQWKLSTYRFARALMSRHDACGLLFLVAPDPVWNALPGNMQYSPP